MPVLPISTIRAIMKQILLGLRLLHEKGIVHRDIKEPNILLHSPPGSGRVIFKIGDLGIVKILKNVNKETLMTKIGTAIFMAPEVEIGDRIADGKVDVWATGLILYQLLCHEYPYDFLEAQFLIRPTIIQDDI
ncbi:MAG: putative AGC family protein kinase, partial [Streblomastix strix]